MDQKAGRDDATQCREASSALVHPFRLAIGLGMIPRVETANGTEVMIKKSSTPGKGISDPNVFGKMPWRRNTYWTGRGKFRTGNKVHSLSELNYNGDYSCPRRGKDDVNHYSRPRARGVGGGHRSLAGGRDVRPCGHRWKTGSQQLEHLRVEHTPRVCWRTPKCHLCRQKQICSIRHVKHR